MYMSETAYEISVTGVQTFCLFFFNDTATTEIYTLSLHDALPIYKFINGMLDKLAKSLRATEAGRAKKS